MKEKNDFKRKPPLKTTIEVIFWVTVILPILGFILALS